MKNKIINNIFLFTITFLVVLKSEAQSTTLVWPGDVNYDGVIDNMDVALFHLYLDFTGPARDIVHQNIFFQGHPAQDWGILQDNNRDIKHFDCNGDGIITTDDYNAIVLNWGSTHLIDPVISNFSDVWPGDLNVDGIVDTEDIAISHLHHGESGPNRTPISIEWKAHSGEDWGILQDNGNDIKHHDCDGNGNINTNDYNAIIANLGKPPHALPFGISPPPPVQYFNTDVQILLQPTNQISINNNLLVFDIVMDSKSGNNIGIFGGFFSIDFASISSGINSIDMVFANSWLGNPNSSLIAENLFNIYENSIDIGFTKTNGANSWGKGIIGELTIQLDSNSLDFSDPCEALVELKVKRIGAFNKNKVDLEIQENTFITNLDESCCEPSIIISQSSPIQNLYQSSNIIATDGYLPIGQNQQVAYNAGNRVTLNSGFSVKAGADFKVRSSGCN